MQVVAIFADEVSRGDVKVIGGDDERVDSGRGDLGKNICNEGTRVE